MRKIQPNKYKSATDLTHRYMSALDMNGSIEDHLAKTKMKAAARKRMYVLIFKRNS